MTSPRLFIRTEASPRIGMGHFMRCFAIAEAARARKIPTTFLLNHVDETIVRLCQPFGMTAEPITDIGPDLPGLLSVLLPQDWLLIDSYQATADYIEAAGKAARVAVIDDLDALDRYGCDLLINAALSAPGDSYARKSHARLLLGADYALIRREFRKPGAPILAEPSVAVMFGGSDPTGLTATVAKGLHEALPGHIIKVIAGPANQQVAQLEAMAGELPRLRLFASPPSVAQVLLKSDIVITAAGGTIGEIAAMGLPALVLVVYDNQKAALDACPYPVIDAREGLPQDLPQRVTALLADPETLKASGRAAHKSIDGKGPQRIVEAMFGV